MRKYFLLLALVFLFNNKGKTQCIIEQLFASGTPLSVSTPGTMVGQSFKPCDTAPLENIKVQITNLSMGAVDLTFSLSQGEGSFTNSIHTQTLNVTTPGIIEFVVNNQPILDANQTYTFNLTWSSTGTIAFSTGAGDMYNPDGDSNTTRLYFNQTGSVGGADLYFSVQQGARINIIPTLNQWGIFIMGLLLLNMSIFLIRELEINKLRKFDVGFFISDKAKNADDAGHQRVFLTQYEVKKTSSNA